MAFEVTWRGASGNSHNFQTVPFGTNFNPVSGVYIFCRQTQPGKWQALYVGETQSFSQRLNERINSHEGFRRAQRMGMTHIGVLVVPGQQNRLRTETDLRHGLKPPANEQSVLGGSGQ